MITTAVFWYSWGKIAEKEAEHGELDCEPLPLWITIATVGVDYWAWLQIGNALA